MAFLSKQGEEDTVAMEPLRRATHTKMFQTSVASPVRRRTIATVPQAASEVEATTVNIVSSPTMAKIVEEKASATETLPTRTRRKCRLSLVSSILLLLIIVQLLSLCIVAGVWYSQYLETTDVRVERTYSFLLKHNALLHSLEPAIGAVAVVGCCYFRVSCVRAGSF